LLYTVGWRMFADNGHSARDKAGIEHVLLLIRAIFRSESVGEMLLRRKLLTKAPGVEPMAPRKALVGQVDCTSAGPRTALQCAEPQDSSSDEESPGII
jgi:hypothetical protein